MATHDYVIDNQSAPAFRADLNLVLQAIVTNNSASTAPAVTYANMFWYETDTNTLWKRNEGNSGWISVGVFDETAGTFSPSGGLPIATQAEAEAGTSNAVLMTPLRVFQALKSLTINIQAFTTSGTWTKPANAIYSEIIVTGAGQAGTDGTPAGMCTPAAPGVGGNAGGTAIVTKIATALGDTETVTVGLGGTTAGASGGTSSFGTHATATGGGATAGTGSGTGVMAIIGGRSDGTAGGDAYSGPGGRTGGLAGNRGGGGGGGTGVALTFSNGGNGYVRVVTYCA